MIEPRPHLKTLYRDVERGARRVDYTRLDRNEKVSPLAAAARQAFFDSLHPDILNAYPDPSPLYERLAKRHGIGEDELFITSGSDTAIRRVFETFVAPGDVVLQPDPSYAMYQVYTQLYQGRAETVAYTASRELPVDELLSRIAERPRLLLIANPDQPTGTAQSPATLRRLADAARDHGVLMVIDEAYYPFHPDSALGWRGEYDNLLVTRTFSKVGGLAGLRIGYVVGPPTLIDWIQRTRGSYEVNAMGIAAACWVIDHPEIEREHVAEVEAGREILRQLAERLGLGFPTCETNFQLLQFPPDTDFRGIVDDLKDQGFLIKGPFSAPAVSDCLRVSLAGPEVIAPFAAAFERVLAPHGIR